MNSQEQKPSAELDIVEKDFDGLVASGVTDYCNQVCGGGNCGTGPLCMYGINAETHMPPRNLRDGGITVYVLPAQEDIAASQEGKRPTNLLVRHFATEAELTAYKAGLDCIENEFDEIDGLNVVGSKVSFTRGTKEENDADVSELVFSTVAEAQAFHQGIGDAEGMHAPLVIEPEDEGYAQLAAYEQRRSEASDETSVKVKHWGAYGIEGTTSTHQFDIADQRTRNGQAFITVGAIDGDLDDMLSVTMEVNTNPLNGVDHVACAHVHFDSDALAVSLFKIGNKILIRTETEVSIQPFLQKVNGFTEKLYWIE